MEPFKYKATKLVATLCATLGACEFLKTCFSYRFSLSTCAPAKQPQLQPSPKREAH